MVGRLCTVFDAAVVLPRPCGLNLRSSEKFISQKCNHLLNLGCLTKQGHTNALYVLPEGGHFGLLFSSCFLVDGWSYLKFFMPSPPPPPQRTACGHVLTLVAAHLETAVSSRLAKCPIRPWDLTLGQ
jgi:hypothetical protein